MIGYVDARRGISGSSLLAALIDAGADVDEIANRLGFLTMREAKLRAEEIVVDGLRTCRVHIDDADGRVAHGPADLLVKLAGAGLSPTVRQNAADVYRRLATAEARVHGMEPDAVRFEELATLRSVVGVLGTLIAFEQLGLHEVVSSPLPFGGGTVETHHGRLPLPAPATLELLRGMPVEPQAVPGELVTPTGAALLASVASGFGEALTMTIDAVGVGSSRSGETQIVTRAVLGRR